LLDAADALDALGARAQRDEPYCVGLRPPVVTTTGGVQCLSCESALIANDDGGLNVTAIAGNRANPTDFIPNAGHLAVGRERGSSFLVVPSDE
jgi:hypothetical protein